MCDMDPEQGTGSACINSVCWVMVSHTEMGVCLTCNIGVRCFCNDKSLPLTSGESTCSKEE